MSLSDAPSRSLIDEVLASLSKDEVEDIWEQSMKSIRTFIRHFVPKDYFDLDKANPQQIQILIDVENGQRNFVVRAPRKGGKTILVAIICVWLALKNAKFRIFVLAGSLEQAKWLYRYCRDIFLGTPLLRNCLLQEPTQTLTELKNGSWIFCSPASDKQIHAPTADVLVMDEYVLIEPDIVVGAWPMIRASKTPMRMILSTARDKVGLESFLDIYDRAEELGFNAYWWSDAQCPWLSKEDSDVAKQVLSEEEFRIQYQGGVPIKKGAVFGRIGIEKAFIKPEKIKRLYPYFSDEIKGVLKTGVDWGFTHDTVFTAGWLGLDFRLHLVKQVAYDKTDDEELANIALDWDQEFTERFKTRVDEWLCDAAGAFQNAMMRKKGLWVTPRVFQHRTEGKEWMVSVVNWFLEHDKLVIPDTKEFEGLKKQMKAYRRDRNAIIVKGFDDKIDSLLCLASGWNPLEAIEAPRERAKPAERIEIVSTLKDVNWEDMKPSGDEDWKPAHWRKERWPWEE